MTAFGPSRFRRSTDTLWAKVEAGHVEPMPGRYVAHQELDGGEDGLPT